MTTHIGPGTRSFRKISLAVMAVGAIMAPASAWADPLGAGGGAIYILSPKAEYQEGCFPPCMCPIMMEQPIGGTFEFVYTGSANTGLHSYAVEDVNWTVPFFDPPLRITGTGKYTIGSPGPITVMQQRMELDLRVGGNAVEHFDSGWVEIGDMSRINVTVSINGMFCYDRVVAIDADRADGQVTPYTLAPGATYEHGCCSPSSPCDCLCYGPVPMVGDFALVPLSDNGLFRDFAVVNIHWQVHSPDSNPTTPIRGFGTYRVGGEFAVQHQLSLELWLGNTGPTHFDSGLVAGGGQFQVIDIFASLTAMDPSACSDTILHVLGEPAIGNAICGGIGGLPCPEGFFCKLPEGACCCDFMGVCAPIPTGCPDVWDPVCGCDGVTYGNECDADAAGVTIAHRGECGKQCGGFAGIPCPDGQFCKLPMGECCCDFFGVCTLIPEVCTEEYAPVCGCDGVTYSNECHADAAGMSVDHPGVCGSPPCAAMPADLPRAACSDCPVGDCGSCGWGTCDDGRVTLCEVIGYVCSWIRGCNDDLSGMTRAAYLWRSGECYCWDEAQQKWTSTLCPAPDSGCCPASDGGAAAADVSISAIDAPTTISVLQSKPNRTWSIAVTIDPPGGTSAAALEVKLPPGWVVTAISHDGAWDDVHRKLKWGPFFDDLARTVTFQVRPMQSAGGGTRATRGGPRLKGVSGTVSFDGVNHPIIVR